MSATAKTTHYFAYPWDLQEFGYTPEPKIKDLRRKILGDFCLSRCPHPSGCHRDCKEYIAEESRVRSLTLDQVRAEAAALSK